MGNGLELEELTSSFLEEHKVFSIEEFADFLVDSEALPGIVKENDNFYMRCSIFEALNHLPNNSLKKQVYDYITKRDSIRLKKIKQLTQKFWEKQKTSEVIKRNKNYYRRCNAIDVLRYANNIISYRDC
jgi:hypothetical protein